MPIMWSLTPPCPLKRVLSILFIRLLA
uniref:Uncharacterized protein n=1 Tax=Arundo donax TaxID=35708 RepID=A0A0A8Y9R9_ARUDO